MKQVGAIAILSTMLIGLVAWAGNNIVNHGLDIAILKANEKNNKEILLEIRQDVKELRKIMTR